jgi:5,10-methenyltetrahydromethanopterin hydrogenase
MRAEQFSRNILALDPRIRFAGVVEKSGHLYAGIRREDAPNKLSDKNSEISLAQSAYIVDLRKMFAQELGELKSVVYNYDGVNIISLPVKDHVLVVSTEVDVKPDDIVHKVRSYVKTVEKDLSLYPPANVVTPEKREMMRNLLESGISEELVAEQLDLDIELVKKLAKELVIQ